MWTTRFFTEFRDDDQGLWRVDIQAPDSSGAPVRLTPAGNPLEWMSSGSESQTENIIGGTGTLRLIVENAEEMALFTANGVLPNSALSRRVIVTREALTVWVGYVQMQTFSQDWEAAPVEIELPLMDTVEALSHIYIDTDETATTTMQLMRSAYAHALQGDNPEATGNEVGGVSLTDFARTNVVMYRGRDGEDVPTRQWSDAPVFIGYYVGPGDKSVRKTYAEALAQILSPFGRLGQTGARWYVGTADVETRTIYRPGGDAGTTWVVDSTATATDISEAIASADNNQSVLPAPSKVTASYEPEEGAVDYSGDTVCEFRADNIRSNASRRYDDVQWQEGEEGQRVNRWLRYLSIASGNSDSAFDWPVKMVNKSYFYAGWGAMLYPAGTFGPVQGRVIEYHSGTRIPGERNWKQVLNHDEGWKVTEAQTYCMACELQVQAVSYEMWADIATWRITQELSTSNIFTLCISFAMKEQHLADDVNYSGVNESTKVWQPQVQLYWSATKDGTPTRVYHRDDGKWHTCNGYINPQSAHDATMIRYTDIKGGKQFHIHNNRGYLSVRIFSFGWPDNGEIMEDTREWAHTNKPGYFFVMTGFKLEYKPWVGSEPTTLLAWDEGNYEERSHTYSNGSEEVTLNFKTLAGSTPTPAAFLAPRWGFRDYAKSVVTTPREMVDIDAVQVTQSDGIPGVTRFSLFQFNSAIYYPAAVGMTAKDNTVRLKLIRTLN